MAIDASAVLGSAQLAGVVHALGLPVTELRSRGASG
jgi:hypothetical protein